MPTLPLGTSSRLLKGIGLQSQVSEGTPWKITGVWGRIFSAS